MLDLLLDNTFILLLTLFALVLGLWASASVRLRFNKYQKVISRSGKTAAEVARQILDSHGLYNVAVVPTHGELTDHYDPRTNTVSLSQPVYNSKSIAAIGIAAHEVGHAVQHSEGYFPIKVRSAVLPVAQIGSKAWLWIFILGLAFNFTPLTDIGIILFFFIFLFQLVTLPVEFDASSRAKQTLDGQFILERDEILGVSQVLGAAAMTYVAAMLSSLATLLRLLARSRRR